MIPDFSKQMNCIYCDNLIDIILENNVTQFKVYCYFCAEVQYFCFIPQYDYNANVICGYLCMESIPRRIAEDQILGHDIHFQ